MSMAAIGSVSVGHPALAQSTRNDTQFVVYRQPPPSRSNAPIVTQRITRPNPVLFWSETALELDALDHSLEAKDARAPGPCCSARALALAHIVMADAVAIAYPGYYDGLYVRGGRGPEREHAEVFIGGATARILSHIYTTPAHTQLIASRRQHFLKFYHSGALAAWNAGLEFGRNEIFTSLWRWTALKDAALSSYKHVQPPRRGRHDVDPFNTDQKFYGANWASVRPLTPDFPLRSLGPADPPVEGERAYAEDLEEVRELGAWRPNGATRDQVGVGLFWAYDGARLIGTPPRLYNQLVAKIAERDGLSTPEIARLLGLCNIAMADAAIVCWEAKYRYQIWRPVLGIPYALRRPDPYWRPFGAPRTNPPAFALDSDAHRLSALSMLGGGFHESYSKPTNNILAYNKACFTPNFPSYPSGHATFGATCFTMLKRVRAERDNTRRDPGRIDLTFVSDELNGLAIDNFRNVARPFWPQTYTRIDDMTDDNNKSRVHLGVHWNFDCALGAISGRQVADAVYRRAYLTRY
jgi:hypothetical protein